MLRDVDGSKLDADILGSVKNKGCLRQWPLMSSVGHIRNLGRRSANCGDIQFAPTFGEATMLSARKITALCPETDNAQFRVAPL